MATIDEMSATTTSVAVSYLRVSTAEQGDRDGDVEGYSIPAQREANRRKAESLGASVVAEFVDRGESARSARRPQLQALLTYVAEHHVDYVIVHKVDRLARNRIDDVEINLALQKAGARLISASESIDETPSGMLLHGIMSSIAEFYSRNLATEVVKGMSQKAKGGGTPSLAPIGYLNVRGVSEEGRETRTIAIDPDRAPLIAWAFAAYASGEWSTLGLARELEQRGLMSRPTPKRPARPLGQSQVHRLLRSPYYKGHVVWRGASHEGRHEALVDEVLWQRVQDMLASHQYGEKQREHPHYLKSSIFCGNCESRLLVTYAKNRYGVIYPYFVCSGRHAKRNDCLRKAILISTIEEKIVEHYHQMSIEHEFREALQQRLSRDFAMLMGDQETEQAALRSQQADLKNQQAKLLQAHYANAVPLDLMASEQERISVQLRQIEERLATLTSSLEVVQANLQRALDLAETCGAAYEQASPPVRRLFNQAFFTHIYVDDSADEVRITGELAEPFASLMPGASESDTDGTSDSEAESGSGTVQQVAPSPGALLTQRLAAEQAARVRERTKPSQPRGREGLKVDQLVPRVGFEPTLKRF